jgi:lipopolysaccharide transport system permease protein
VAVVEQLGSEIPRAGASLPEVVYAPVSELRHPGRLIRTMLGDLYGGRGLAWRLFVRDIRARYRQTYLGYLWAVLPALATTFLWVFLKSRKVVSFEAPSGLPYAVYVLTGVMLWQLFTGSLRSPLRAVESSRVMLGKLNFHREAVLASGLGQILFDFVLSFLVLCGLMCFYRPNLPVTVLLFPIGAMMVMVLGYGIGLVLTPIGLLYKDVERTIDVVLQYGFFLTPVIYPPLVQWPGSLLNWVNPVAPVLIVTRDSLLVGSTEYLIGFLAYSLFGIVALAAGLVAFRLSMPIVIERMGS